MGFSRQEYWSAISPSKETSRPRDWTHGSCISRWVLYHGASNTFSCHFCGLGAGGVGLELHEAAAEAVLGTAAFCHAERPGRTHSRDGSSTHCQRASSLSVCCDSDPNEDEGAELWGSGVEPKCHDGRNGGAEAFSSTIVHKVGKDTNWVYFTKFASYNNWENQVR